VEELAEAATAGKVVEAPVGEGGEASAGAEAGEDVIENGDLEAVREGGPGKARDDDVEGGVVWPEGGEVELLGGGGFEVVAGMAGAEGLDEIVVEFEAEVLGVVRHGIEDGSGEGTGSRAEFDDALSAPDFGDFGHAGAQSGGGRSDGADVPPVFEGLPGEGER
jgi:hypothetical protein